MSDDSLREILEAQAHFGLPSAALVEKDVHVVRALAAIAGIDTKPYRLVFGGGTALGRAHRVIRRMSKDIDLKIVEDDRPSRTALRRLRESVTKALLAAGFDFDPNDPARRKSGNESRYTIFQLPYAAVARGEGALRPEIQIEMGVWPLRRPTVELPVTSFVAEAFKRPPEVAKIACVSITQTAAEKFVALTRRIAAEIGGGKTAPRDATLVRHIYDLHATRQHYDVAETAKLAREIMPHDAEVFGNLFPAYRDDPIAATRRALEGLDVDPGYAQRYDEFCRLMVYGDAIDYATALRTLHDLAQGVL